MARSKYLLGLRNRQATQVRKEDRHNEGIFDDKPVDQQVDDHLKVDHLVNSLAHLIARQRSSLTIGVYGEWGSGKTSFLQLLKERLQQKDIGIYPIWFNAWKYNKKDNLWAALIQTIINQSGKEGKLRRRLWIKFRVWLFGVNFKAGSWDITKNAIALLLRILVVFACLFAGLETQQIAAWLKSWLLKTTVIPASFIPVLVAVALAAIAIVAADPLKLWDLFKGDIHFDFSKFEEQLSYRNHIAFLDEFSDQFQRLIGLLGQRNKQLVIIIDDLDRCLPEHALQVLEAIKVLLDNANCVFLLGVDNERLQKQFLELHKSRFDEDYFDKIIQQAVSVPRLSQEKKQVENFIRKLNTPVGGNFSPDSRGVDPRDNTLDPDVPVPVSDKGIIDRHVELCAPIFALGLPPNPRKIKRSLRSFRFVRDMILERIKEDAQKPQIDENSIKTGDIHASLLAKLIVIRDQYKPFYEVVIEQPGICKQLEPFYRGPKQDWSPEAESFANKFSKLSAILGERIDEADAFAQVEDVHLYIEQIGTLAEMGHFLEKAALPIGTPLLAAQPASAERILTGALPASSTIIAGSGAPATGQLAPINPAETLLATGYPPSITIAPPRYLPVERNRLFASREDTLLRLHDAFLSQGSRMGSTVALCGLGGIGKTQIAIEYAYRYQADYSAVFWVRADTTDRLLTDYIAIAERIYMPERFSQNQEQIIEAVKNWLATHAGWLLILDGVTDFESVRTYLPHTSSGNILLTMRRQPDDSSAIISIDVEPFQTDDGTLLLLRRAGIIHFDSLLTGASPTDRRTAREIVQALDGLPLALDQAGAYIQETGCGLDGYLKQYQENSEKLLSRRGYSSSHPEPISTTLSLSFTYVQQESPAAAELLRLCAFLAPDGIPLEMLVQSEVELGQILESSLETQTDLQILLKKLEKFSLVRRNMKENTLSLHRLVQTVLKEKGRMDMMTQRQWAERAIELVNSAFPEEVRFETWATCLRYLPQALACAVLVDQYHIDSLAAAQLLDRTGRYLRDRVPSYARTEGILKSALAIREQKLGPEHPYTTATLNTLASLYNAQSRFTEAEPLLTRAIAIREQKLGPEHPEVATNLNELALIYLAQSRYTEAEPMFLRALSIRESRLATQPLDVAASLNGLADLYHAQNRDKEAEPLSQRALSIRENTLGTEHPLVATSLNNLAALYLKQGKYALAAESFQRALTIRKRVLGEQHQDVAVVQHNLAGVYAQQGKFDEARRYYEQALATYEKAVGADSLELIPTLWRFAEFLRQFYQNQPEMIALAEKMEARTREIQELYEQGQ